MKTIKLFLILILSILSTPIFTENLSAAGPICTEAFKNAQSENPDDLKQIELFNKCITEEGLGCEYQYSAAYHNRGVHYFHLKRYNEALSDLNQSIQMLPKDSNNSYKYLESHYKFRSKIYRAMGKTKEAEADDAEVKKYKKLQ